MFKMKKVRRNITIDKDVLVKFQKLAKDKGLTLSGWVNSKLNEFVEEEEKRSYHHFANADSSSNIAIGYGVGTINNETDVRIPNKITGINQKSARKEWIKTATLNDLMSGNTHLGDEYFEVERRLLTGEITDEDEFEAAKRFAAQIYFPVGRKRFEELDFHNYVPQPIEHLKREDD